MASGNKLIFKDAEAARDAIVDSQRKEIADLYEKWADDIGEKAKKYSHKTNPSAAVSERQMKELKKQLTATSHEVSNEIYSKIKKNMYTISDAVVADNVKWLESFGFSKDGLNAAFTYVPDEIVRNLITGQIYDSGWSLSSKIWGDNEATLKDIYQIMGEGLAKNKTIYEIAKDLEKYVRPSAKLPWNLKAKDGAKIYKKKVDYNAQRLARTLVQHGYQQSFIATTQKNPFITEYIWRSNGSRVCPLCMARDGQHFKKDSLPMDHPNGMCTMEPAVAEDMVDQLAEWFNSPDGTFPEIDEFAGNFGYEASKVGTVDDFIAKYGKSDKSLAAWHNGMSPIQKAEAKALKDKAGQTWQEFYESNIYTGTGTSKPVKAKKPKTTKTKDSNAFTDVQKKYLEPYGFTPDNMPKDFDDWSHKVSYEQATEILKSMGTDWSDPHPYQQLMKFYNANLVGNNSSITTPITTTKTTVAKKPSVIKTISELGDLTIDNLDDYIATANSGSNKAYKTIEKMFSDNGFWLDDFLDDNYNIDTNSTKFKEAVAKITSKVTATSTTVKKPTSTASTISSSFDLASWKASLSSNNTRDMDNWTNDWLAGITGDEKNGVYKYTSNAYIDMNSYLRGFRSSTSYEKEIKNCQAALAKASLPRETIVRRGSDYNMLDSLGLGKITPDTKGKFIGGIVGDKGFTSTSPDPHGGFSGDIEYVIKLPKGSQAMYIDSISRYSGEQELLINCDSKYIIEEVEFNKYGDVSKIYMTLINLQ